MHAQRSITVLSLALSLINLIVIHVQAASVTAQLSWTAPTKDANGGFLTGLAGYKVYYGLASRSYGAPTNVSLTTNAAISGLQEDRPTTSP